MTIRHGYHRQRRRATLSRLLRILPSRPLVKLVFATSGGRREDKNTAVYAAVELVKAGPQSRRAAVAGGVRSYTTCR